MSKTTVSLDGVRIADGVSRSADTTIVFVHGRVADRSFWEGSIRPRRGLSGDGTRPSGAQGVGTEPAGEGYSAIRP